MEIEPGIHQLAFGREPLPGFPPPNAFLVVGSESAALIDAGWENEDDHRARAAYLREVGAPPVSEIIVTHRHPDHGGGALHMHRDTGAPIACHPNDREAIEQERLHGEAAVAREMRHGDKRDLGGISLEAVFAPGHTAGCIALFSPERKALFTSDTVMAVSTTSIAPQDGDLADYVDTLRLLQDVDARIMYTGHGGPVKDPPRRLEALIRHREAREREILDALRDGPLTPAELRVRIYKGLPEARERLAERQLVTTLVKLTADGAVAAEEGDRYALG